MFFVFFGQRTEIDNKPPFAPPLEASKLPSLSHPNAPPQLLRLLAVLRTFRKKRESVATTLATSSLVSRHLLVLHSRQEFQGELTTIINPTNHATPCLQALPTLPPTHPLHKIIDVEGEAEVAPASSTRKLSGKKREDIPFPPFTSQPMLKVVGVYRWREFVLIC